MRAKRHLDGRNRIGAALGGHQLAVNLDRLHHLVLGVELLGGILVAVAQAISGIYQGRIEFCCVNFQI